MSLMGIGEFAARSRLSQKALRLYDELGLLPPARVDPASGYRWYAHAQLEQARLVASLRRIGVPLAQIKVMLSLDAGKAAEQVASYWAEAEAEHSGRRELAGYLVDHLNGKESVMYEISLREMPARTVLYLIVHAHTEELMTRTRDLMRRLRPVATPQPNDPVTALFMIFHGEVSEDSDGPVELCWPVPDDRASEIAVSFPELTVRTEPAHQEAFVHTGQDRLGNAALTPVIESLFRWTQEQHRQPSGGLRQILISNPAAGANGPDGEWAIALKQQ
jgi:DNA-binding transcriptional MerR regulator